MSDSALAEKKRETSASAAINAFFDERIEKMSPRQLERFEKRADKIVAGAKSRASRVSAGPRGSAQSKSKASRA